MVGVIAFFYLTDRLEDAALARRTSQRDALTAALRAEDERKRAHGPATVLAALRDPRVLFLSLIYFAVQMSVYGVVFYLPTRIAGLTGGHVGIKVGLLTAIPWIAAIAAAPSSLRAQRTATVIIATGRPRCSHLRHSALPPRQ